MSRSKHGKYGRQPSRAAHKVVFVVIQPGQKLPLRLRAKRTSEALAEVRRRGLAHGVLMRQGAGEGEQEYYGGLARMLA